MMRDAQITELFGACKSLERDAAFLVSDFVFSIRKWETNLLSKEQLYDPTMAISLRLRKEIQCETHSFRDRLLNFIFYARSCKTNLKANLSNFS